MGRIGGSIPGRSRRRIKREKWCDSISIINIFFKEVAYFDDNISPFSGCTVVRVM